MTYAPLVETSPENQNERGISQPFSSMFQPPFNQELKDDEKHGKYGGEEWLNNAPILHCERGFGRLANAGASSGVSQPAKVEQK